jgi:hypothetical protein
LEDPAAPDATKPEGDAIADPFFQPGKPEEFKLPPLDLPSATETVRVAETVRGWLSTAQLPADVGSSLAGMVHNYVTKNPDYENRSDVARQTEQIVTRSRIEKHWKGDTAKNVALAVQLVNEIEAKRPGLKAFLEKTGAGNDPNLIIRLGEHAKRLAARAR